MAVAKRLPSCIDIRRAIERDFEWEPALDAAGIGVAVTDDCVVTLTGHVRAYPQSRLAEQLAKRVPGVRAVANDLDVRIPHSGVRDDTDLAQAVVHALEWNSSIPASRMRVTVQEGWVTLEGDVDWRYQQEAAVGAVEHLIGVKGVSNAIRISHAPAADPEAIRARIEVALEGGAETEARLLTITVSDGQVVLGGAVRSAMEREDAERAAWSSRGVREVDNRIVVIPHGPLRIET